LVPVLLQHGATAVAEHGDPAAAIFGWSALAVATVIFILTYAVVMSERFNRANVALLAAGLTVLLGVINQHQAVAGVDFNTIGLLVGMMLIVAVTRETGVFQFLAIWSAKKVKAKPWGILLMLSIVTAVTSAFLDNVTTVLLIVPVTLVLTEELEVPPYPFLFAEILFSNIGGTATLIGDPPNIMIGSQVEYITFLDFIVHLGPVVLVVMVATLFPIYLIWGRKLRASDEARQRVMDFDEKAAITDWPLLIKCLLVLAAVIFGFIVGHPFGFEPATIAITGGALLMLLSNLGRKIDEKNERVHHFFGHVEWTTIFFFVGLFVVVAGVEHAGLLDMLATEIVERTEGDRAAISYAVLWVSAIASSIVDNIPFVATMIPTLKTVIADLGMSQSDSMALWWSLALGACMGGNGSLVGASANLIVAGFAERAGQRIQFTKFLLHAFPLMLMSIAICHVYIMLRYL
jgi:Na+/H+ antiporter NhaD/arsenite permease-like protein